MLGTISAPPSQKENDVDRSICMCGHVEDEHGHDPDYPGSSSCTIKGCECVAFDPDVIDDDHGKEGGT